MNTLNKEIIKPKRTFVHVGLSLFELSTTGV
jgi:hypothetical protein